MALGAGLVVGAALDVLLRGGGLFAAFGAVEAGLYWVIPRALAPAALAAGSGG